jgi:hypothetical protein
VEVEEKNERHMVKASLETALLTQPDSRYRGLPPLTADTLGWYSVSDQEKY